MDLAYKEAYAMNPQAARTKLVETYLETGIIAETARRWHTSRNVVRKWVERFRDDRVRGLGDRVSPPPPLSHPDQSGDRGRSLGGEERDWLEEEARLVPVAGEGLRSLSPHDPPHPLPARVHRAQEEAEDVLPCPLSRGRRSIRSP